MNDTTCRPSTRAVRAGLDADLQHGAVMPPLYLTSTYTYAGFDEPRQHDYSRTSNPTRDLFGATLAGLEGGAGGLVTSTGMSAVALVLQLLPRGGRVLAPLDCYGGVYRLLTAWQRRGLLEVQFADLSDPEARRAAIASRPALVWVETPSNPLLRITDIEATCREAHAVGALVVVDSTFLSPVLQQPLALGADIVLHSTTKYINGHSDVVGGAVVARDAAVHTELAWWSNCLGVCGAPFDSFLALRGLRTLHLRMQAHEQNARALVETLVAHPAVARVNYPGLGTHPGHAIARRQQSGYGAMLSFELRGGTPAARALLDGLRQFSLAESLGGVESLVCHPPTMTHASMDPEARVRAGISDALLRVSVGVEALEDLRADLVAGLDRAAALTARTGVRA